MPDVAGVAVSSSCCVPKDFALASDRFVHSAIEVAGPPTMVTGCSSLSLPRTVPWYRDSSPVLLCRFFKAVGKNSESAVLVHFTLTATSHGHRLTNISQTQKTHLKDSLPSHLSLLQSLPHLHHLQTLRFS